MGSVRRIQKNLLWFASLVLSVQTQVLSYQYKVGDLDAWGLPTSSNRLVYTSWSKNHEFKIGDCLLFLYPPSQDSVAQVTEQSYNSCNLTDPILYMNNGNSLFNITSPGDYYFTSGQQGHCQKSQKLHISVLSANGSSSSSPSSPSYAPADSPSYQNVFGTIPAPPSPSSSTLISIPVLLSAALGFFISAALGTGNM